MLHFIIYFCKRWNLPMMTEKYIISLIMECTDSPSLKLRVIVEECPKHACYYPAKASPEVVENHFRSEERNKHILINGGGDG